MTEIKIYEINADYVDYLAPFAPHLFRNSKKGQANTRKYIGIVLHSTDMITSHRFPRSNPSTKK